MPSTASDRDLGLIVTLADTVTERWRAALGWVKERHDSDRPPGALTQATVRVFETEAAYIDAKKAAHDGGWDGDFLRRVGGEDGMNLRPWTWNLHELPAGVRADDITWIHAVINLRAAIADNWREGHAHATTWDIDNSYPDGTEMACTCAAVTCITAGLTPDVVARISGIPVERLTGRALRRKKTKRFTLGRR